MANGTKERGFMRPMLVIIVVGVGSTCRAGVAESPRVLDVSTGTDTTCVIKGDDQSALCWGRATHGRVERHEGPFTAITCGGYHVCALAKNQEIVCWGSSAQGVDKPPSGTFTQLSGGSTHHCGLRTDGTLACWGSNVNGKATPPKGLFERVAAGLRHTCALTTDGRVLCWGENTHDQARAPEGEFVDIGAGEYDTCATRKDGSLLCWGNKKDKPHQPFEGKFIQLDKFCMLRSDGKVLCRQKMLGHDPPDEPFVRVSGWRYHACGLRKDGTMRCWGTTRDGASYPPTELEYAGEPPEITPLPPATHIACGRFHCCRIDENQELRCWGRYQGVPPAGKFILVAAAEDETCAISERGALFCWYAARGITQNTHTPNGEYVQVAVGKRHGCAIRKEDHKVVCWGGYDKGLPETKGKVIPPEGELVGISAKRNVTCGLDPQGYIYCWGPYTYPAQRIWDHTFVQVAAEYRGACGLKADTNVLCYGGARGHELYGIKQVSVGWDGYVCGVDGDGDLQCNGGGRLTDKFTEISVGGDFGCGLKVNGGVKCWGGDAYGETHPERLVQRPRGYELAQKLAWHWTEVHRREGTFVRIIDEGSRERTVGLQEVSMVLGYGQEDTEHRLKAIRKEGGAYVFELERGRVLKLTLGAGRIEGGRKVARWESVGEPFTFRDGYYIETKYLDTVLRRHR